MDTGIQVYKDARVQGYTEIVGGGLQRCKKLFSYRNEENI